MVGHVEWVLFAHVARNALIPTLTLLGMFSAPMYGGNFQGSGWKMMGFADQHAFTPPFGYYDREYAGFVPYSEKSV